MTIRKLWLMVLIVVVMLSVGMNAVILMSLTDRYFKDYMSDNYEAHVHQLIDYTQKALIEEDVSFNQMKIELETHLDDPITRIKLYNQSGELLVDVYTTTPMMRGRMMMGAMMNNMQGEVDQYTLTDEEITIGTLNITTNSSAEHSMIAQMFKSALVMNSLRSILFAILISVVIGVVVSKKMSTALKETAEMAQGIQVGNDTNYKKTNIQEINTVRDSLKTLNVRLKLKQKSRKTLVDELVHQTRTPLTVLKSHLEALEDGIIEMTSDEINVCQHQVENITNIITNMRGMIDAEADVITVNIEEVEFSQLIKQIVDGLTTQFHQKGISLDLDSNKKFKIRTDKYKLSQAIYNVLTNAYKYTNKDGKVTIGYTVNQKTLTVKIEDTGIGINKNELDKIFNAYYRSDDVVNSTGEGIGLYIAKENLKIINGNIKVESQKNVGSCFIIEVPI